MTPTIADIFSVFTSVQHTLNMQWLIFTFFSDINFLLVLSHAWLRLRLHAWITWMIWKLNLNYAVLIYYWNCTNLATGSIDSTYQREQWPSPWKYGERERNVLFNDALNTFYLWLYGVRHMVKDHSDSEKGHLLPPHRLLLSINSKGSFICTIPQTG